MKITTTRRIRKGFSLTELILVILIIGMLAAVGFRFGGRQISNARMSTISSNLKIVASDVEKAVIDLGFLADVETEETTKTYFRTWDAKYLSCPLDTDNIATVPLNDRFGSGFSGAVVNTMGYADPWGHELQLFYLVPSSGRAYRIIIASAGPNGIFSPDAAAGYINNDFEDDVVMVMEPRDT